MADSNAVTSTSRNAGRVLVDALALHGTDRIFCVPGESYLDVLDALCDVPQIDVVVAKHEGAAANMAEADGKLTGRPGICFVTRGPGATHASTGVHTAFQDSTPMILFIGQIDNGFRDREGFQEVDYRSMFAPLAKWVAEIDDAARIPEYVLRAFQCATSGRPGPVVLSLPEDMLAQVTSVSDTRPYKAVHCAPANGDIAALSRELQASRAPMLLLGGSGWTEAAVADMTAFAEAFRLPVIVSFRRQDLIDNEHPNYAGHLTLGTSPKLAARVRAADLLIVVGSRLGEVTTSGYTLPEPPLPMQRLIHVHMDPNELSRVYQPNLAIASGIEAIAAALRALPPLTNIPWGDLARDLHKEFVEFTSLGSVKPSPKAVDMVSVITSLTRQLPSDAIITNGAGNFTVWVHRYHRYRKVRTELAPTSGAMGYGLPAAIAAKLRYPDRAVICFAGDGDFLMYPQELATAMQFGASIIVLVVNNGLYGTIRMHQARRFPGRLSGTSIQGPDMVALAKSFGAYAERVESTAEFEAAYRRAAGAGRLALLDLIVDPDQITPSLRLSDSKTQQKLGESVARCQEGIAQERAAR
jgi:acetolactate synthase-1/2/3 large subunit